MGKRAIRVFLVALVMVSTFWGADIGSGGGVSSSRRPTYVPGEVLVKYKPAARAVASAYFERRWGVSTLRTFHDVGVQHVRLPVDMTVEQALELYRGNPDVEYVEPNYYRHITVTPNDTDYGLLWGLNDIDAPDAWDITHDCSGKIVAIIDTGADYNHPDLAANIAPGGYDFVDNDSYPMDQNGHGTHVAGTIAAVGNNARGVAGVCWTGKLMILRAFDPFGFATLSDIISAMAYARTNNAKIINASYAGGDFSQAERDEISNLSSAGILLIAAAGNEGTDNDANPSYPASYDLPNIIAVAATDENDNLAWFSNYGRTSVHVAAPGTDIYSTKPGRQTVFSDNFDDDDISDWTVDPHWALSSEANSPPYALALVPGDAEGKGLDLIARPTNAIVLSGQTGILLSFMVKANVAGGDLLFVETSADGTNWTRRPVLVNDQDLFENGISGSVASWVDASVDLGSLDGSPTMYFRFRFHTQKESSGGGGGGGGGCFIGSSAYGSPLSLGATQAAAAANVVYIDDVQITTAGVEDVYQYLSGTSMATPHVVGLAALVWSQTPTLTASEVKARILNSVERLTDLALQVVTWGRINASKSIANVPAEPVGLAATARSNSRIDLSWASTYYGQIGFKIERKSGSGSFTEVKDLQNNITTWSDTNLASSTAYTYRVRAYYSGGNLSGYSAEAGASTL